MLCMCLHVRVHIYNIYIYIYYNRFVSLSASYHVVILYLFLPLISISHLFLLPLSPRTCSHVSSARGVVDRSRRSLKMIALNGRNGDARRAITPDKLFVHKQVSLRRLTIKKPARVQHPRAKLMGKLNGRTSAPLGAATEDSKKRDNCIAHVNTSSASSEPPQPKPGAEVTAPPAASSGPMQPQHLTSSGPPRPQQLISSVHPPQHLTSSGHQPQHLTSCRHQPQHLTSTRAAAGELTAVEAGQLTAVEASSTAAAKSTMI